MDLSDQDLPSAEVLIDVPFFDADMLGIVWHGHYAKYFEIARCALLDKLDYDYLTMKETGYVWPVIELNIRYIAPARFGQQIRVTAALKEYEYRMRIRYEILDAKTANRLAKGMSSQVAVNVESGEMCFGSPRVFLEKLQAFVRRPPQKP
ncbi:MAG: 4-hydroxybenzoyl-CoA thioesterase [Methylothermaceae bacteria B42]|nr:MAG: 4-hydroxybenzoyl-CoA thioesterase [Methylothermaceae bacteria B42]HHJ40465.1 acyl-CoA thioesterase [Methylothermaceae bacterium]